MKQLKNTQIDFIELYTRGDEQANQFYQKLGFEMVLETYDVFGLEKGLRKHLDIEGIEDKRLIIKNSDGEACDFAIVNGVYEVYNKEALNRFDYDRYYPSRGYIKYIK